MNNLTDYSVYADFPDDWIKDLENPLPLPLHKMIFNFIFYKIPFKIQSTYWYIREFYQRGRYGVSDSDWWVLYLYVAKILSFGCEKIANNGNGYPPYMSEQEWSDVVCKVRQACSRVVEIEDSGCFPNENDRKQIEEAFNLLGKHFWYFWD